MEGFCDRSLIWLLLGKGLAKRKVKEKGILNFSLFWLFMKKISRSKEFIKLKIHPKKMYKFSRKRVPLETNRIKEL